MSEREPTYEELKARLKRAESILDALRWQKVDAPIDEERVSTVRLREVERALQKTEARYRNLAENLDGVVYRIDQETRKVVYVNSAVEPLLGYSVDEWTEDPTLPKRVVHPDDKEWVFDSLREARRNREPCVIEYRIVRKDGSVRWVENRASWEYAEDGTILSSNGIVYDITDRKEAEAALRELTVTLEEKVQARTEKLKELSIRLTRAEQAERHRIAQLLHDDLQQLLYSIRLSLSTVGDGLAQGNYDKEALLQTLAKAGERTAEAVQITRRLNVELSPPILEGEGLTETLNWLALQMQEQCELTVEVDAAGSFPVADDDLRLLLFHSVRELLFNVVKHAEVDHATVTLRRVDDELRVQIADEGVGFDVEQAIPETPSGWGLASVRERLELVGGHMDVASELSKGTRVTLYAPATWSEIGTNEETGA